MYEYQAKCLRVIDGDTIVARVDLGFHIAVEKTLRLRGVNTPEVRTRNLIEKRKGLAAKARVVDLMEKNNFEFNLISYNVGKYGRVIADVIFLRQGDLGELLLAEGHAEKMDMG